MTRIEAIAKLEKLKAFLERDCGAESDNARRIAEKLMREHSITSAEFSYAWHADEFAQAKKREAEEKDAQARKSFYDFINKMRNHDANKKAAEDTARYDREQRERTEREQRARANARANAEESRTWIRASYSSYMRNALLDLLRHLNIQHRANGAKVGYSATLAERARFERAWRSVKRTCQNRIDAAIREVCNDINSSKY